jgi:hypothetical protein
VVSVPNATELAAIVAAMLTLPEPSNDPDVPVTSPVSEMVLPVASAVAVDALPTKSPCDSVMPEASMVECVVPSTVTVIAPVPESATAIDVLPSVIVVDDSEPTALSTYALIDCCVARCEAEFDAMLSSSLVMLVSVTSNDMVCAMPSPVVAPDDEIPLPPVIVPT